MTPEMRLAAAGISPERVRRARETGDLGALAGSVALPLPESEIVSRLEAVGARFVLPGDDGYPSTLGGLPDAPPWLFVRGELPGGTAVAVVGSRKASAYGLGMAEAIGRIVAGAGWPVVSGLAAGVDAAAHRGCLDAGGVAVAVLGSGIDRWYPSGNRGLGERILGSGGAVVSEFGPGIAPEPWRFPARNRIISGLSGAVVVVEAAEKSGALVTARLALDQGRDVFAVPGDVDRPTSRGTNRLIRDGAIPVVAVDEIVEDLELVLGPAPGRAVPPRDPTLVGAVPRTVSEIVAETGLSLGAVLSELARLELSGEVVEVEGRYRARRPESSHEAGV